MPTCPSGHQTAGTDFCDVCGMRLGGPGPARVPAPTASASTAPAQTCPQCGAHRSGQFCEACGYDFASGNRPARGTTAPAAVPAPAVPAPAVSAGDGRGAATAWTAVVTADRAYFDSVIASGSAEAAAIQFPPYCPERSFRLSGSEVRIGRRSATRGLEPEIDLTGPPLDPGVSHLHAVLIAEPDGGWVVLDPGSANGTTVNGREVVRGARVRLRDGDRVGVGAWTVLTIRAS